MTAAAGPWDGVHNCATTVQIPGAVPHTSYQSATVGSHTWVRPAAHARLLQATSTALQLDSTEGTRLTRLPVMFTYVCPHSTCVANELVVDQSQRMSQHDGFSRRPVVETWVEAGDTRSC
jgi:hypothetical protein